jgi:hypothetical protein
MYKKKETKLKKILFVVFSLFYICYFSFADEDISQKDTLTIATHSNLELLMYVKNGQAKGYCPELITRIAELKNLTIKYKIFGPNVIPTEMAKDPDVDFVILSPLFQTEEIRKQCTNEFHFDDFVSITRQGEIFNNKNILKIGLIRIHAINEPTFKLSFPKSDFFYYESLRDVLRAVNDGSLDIGICTEDRAEYLLRSPYFTKLVLNNSLVQSYGMALWAVNDKGRACIPIINDGIDLLVKEGSQRLITANVRSSKYK